MKQKYIDAVRYFRSHPDELERAWTRPNQHEHGCLFQFCSPDGRGHKLGDETVGCPVMIAGHLKYVAWTEELTKRCRAEVPDRVTDLTDKDLVKLARLQNEMDQTIRNPTWLAEHQYACHPMASDPLVQAGLRKFGQLIEENDELI